MNKVSTGKKYMWFSLGSGMFAVSTLIFTVLIARLSGETIGGMFAIGLSVAQWIVTIAYFEIRTLQVTDVNQEYSFSDYLTIRLAMCVVAFLACIGYCVVMGYSNLKLIIVIMLYVYKMLEGVADVFEGEFQRADRIDISGKSMFFRTLAALFSLTVILLFTNNIVLALIGMNVCVLGVVLALNVFPLARWTSIRIRTTKTAFATIFKCCLPLAVCGFLSTYLVNSSKLAVDRNMGDKYQLYYTAVFMPNLVINLLSGIVFKPMQSTLAKQYLDGEKSKMFKTVIKIVLMIVGITVSCIAGGYIIGRRLLELFYGIALFEYRHTLTVLLLAGGVNAVNIILYYCLVIQRKQNGMLVIYAISSILSFPILECCTQRSGLMGAAWGYLFTVLILCLLLGISILRKDERKGNE